MEQTEADFTVQKHSSLLTDPIQDLLQAFQSLSEERCPPLPPLSVDSFPKVDVYGTSKLPCLVYETFNKCSNEKCEYAHGQRCSHCLEDVLPTWNAALRDDHEILCRAKLQELRRRRSCEQPLSWLNHWLNSNAEDEENWDLKNQLWY